MISATPTPGQALNRGNNLLVSGFLVSLATGLIGLLVSETEWIDCQDDGLVIFLAVVAAGWYLGKDHRYTWSLVPFGRRTRDPSHHRFAADHHRIPAVEDIPGQDYAKFIRGA